MPPPARTLTRDDVIDLLTVIAATDGHPRGQADVDLWIGAAQRGNWTLQQAVAAAQLVCDGFTGYRIMPGHIAEKIRAERRQPATVAELLPPPAELAARIVHTLPSVPGDEPSLRPRAPFTNSPMLSRWAGRRPRRPQLLTPERRAAVEAELAQARAKTTPPDGASS